MNRLLRILSFVLLTAISSHLCAQYVPTPPVVNTVGGGSWWNTDYNTTEGTDFWVTYMRNSGKGYDDDLFLRLFASARQDADVVVRFNRDTLSSLWNVSDSITFHIDALSMNGLSNDSAIPNKMAYVQEPTDLYKGVYVHATSPITLYALNYFASSNGSHYDAAIVYPLTALFNEYVIQSYQFDDAATEFVIVATEDATSVSMKLRETTYDYDGNIVGVVNSEEQFLLEKGNTFYVRSHTAEGDLTGTIICADKPVAVLQGNQSGMVNSRANHIFEPSISTDKWGRRFIITRSANHNYDQTRLTAASNGTEVYINGNYETTLDQGETYNLEIEWADYSNTPIIIETSEVVSCGLYIGDIDGGGSGVSASSYTLITPLENSLNSTITASFGFDDSFTQNHYINVVVPTAHVGFMRLDGRDVSGSFRSIPRRINDVAYSYAQLSVDAGPHLLSNESGTFVAHVYGLASKGSVMRRIYEGYAYSAGSRVNHAADILINDKYVAEDSVCINEDPVKFSAVIKYSYDSLRWVHYPLSGTDTYEGNMILYCIEIFILRVEIPSI